MKNESQNQKNQTNFIFFKYTFFFFFCIDMFMTMNHIEPQVLISLIGKKRNYCNTITKIILFIYNNGCKNIFYCLPKSICGFTLQSFHLQCIYVCIVYTTYTYIHTNTDVPPSKILI